MSDWSYAWEYKMLGITYDIALWGSADIILKMKEVEDIWCYDDRIDLHGWSWLFTFQFKTNQRYDEMAKWWYDDMMTKPFSLKQINAMMKWRNDKMMMRIPAVQNRSNLPPIRRLI